MKKDTDLNLFNFDTDKDNLSGVLTLSNEMIRGRRSVNASKSKTSDGKVRYMKTIKTSDKKIEDTMIEIFSNKSEKNKINYDELIINAKQELEKDFIKYDIVETPEKTKTRNKEIREIREIALNNYVKKEVAKMIPKTIEIDIKDFIKRTGIVRIQNRFDEALNVLHEASGKMNYSWNEIILSEDYSKINYDIVYGSIVPSFRLRLKDTIKEHVSDPRTIDSLEKFASLDIPKKANYVENLVLEINSAAVLNILGIGLWNKKGHTKSLRKNRDSFSKSVAFDLDFLARSIINIPHIKKLTHFTLDEMKERLGSTHYASWDTFRRSVFVPAIEDVNKNTELNVSYELVPNHKNWTHIHLVVRFKTNMLGQEINPKFGYDALAYFIAIQHKYFQKNNLDGPLSNFIQYIQSLIYSCKEKEEIYSKTLAQWKEYAKNAYEAEEKILTVLTENPDILSKRNLKYDDVRMVVVKVNQNQDDNDVEYNEEGEENFVEPKKLPETSYIVTSKYKVVDPVTSLMYITEHIQQEEAFQEKANIFDFIPFYFATLDMKWINIDSMETYITYKEPIRTAVYKKKKTFFKFLDASGNVEENKKELFLRYMESESFKEVDNKFKELIMSASN